jgi:hypothetical protein
MTGGVSISPSPTWQLTTRHADTGPGSQYSIYLILRFLTLLVSLSSGFLDRLILKEYLDASVIPRAGIPYGDDVNDAIAK